MIISMIGGIKHIPLGPLIAKAKWRKVLKISDFQNLSPFWCGIFV